MSSKSNDCNPVEKAHHAGHHGDKGHHNSQREAEDIAASKMAYELWKSDKPENWDKALDMREKLQKHAPKSWDKAMKQVDQEEAAAKRRHLPAPHAPEYVDPRRKQAPPVVQNGELPPPPPPGAPPPPPEQRHINGYAPDVPPTQDGPYPDQFAPPTPASPAFDAAYNRPPSKFYGLDIGILQLGVTDRGSMRVGAGIPYLAHAQVDAGLDNRVEGEVGGGYLPFHARAGAGAGYDIKGNQGLHSEVGAGANVANAVNGDFDIEAHANKQGLGTNADLRGKVLPVNSQFDAGANVGQNGADAYTGGDVNVMHKAGFRTGGELAVGKNSRMAAGLGLQGGDKTIDLGTHVETYGNRTIAPKLVDVQTGNADEATFYPTGDRNVDYNPPKQ